MGPLERHPLGIVLRATGQGQSPPLVLGAHPEPPTSFQTSEILLGAQDTSLLNPLIWRVF